MRKLAGFTLMEMMIVIVCLGILYAALLPKLRGYKERVMNVTSAKDMNDLNYALSMYFYDKGSYPVASTCSAGVKTDCSLSSLGTVLAQYIRSIPQTSYPMPANWQFGSGYQVPTANQYGYVGLGNQYIFTYHAIDTRDSQQYRVVNMPDSKIWLAENLNYATNGSVCYGGTGGGCLNDYGRLYTRDDAQTACALGRHLASSTERSTLTNKVGATASTQLKSTQDGGTDVLGFSLLLAGRRVGNGNNWNDRSSAGYYRTSQPNGANDATAIKFDGTSVIDIGTHNKNTYFAIRCVKD